jgi:hypothetical protein
MKYQYSPLNILKDIHDVNTTLPIVSENRKATGLT